MCPQNAYSVDIVLAWDANTENDLDGYKIFRRVEGESYNYDDPVLEVHFNEPGENPQEPTCTIYNLEDNITHYFVVRSFDTAGLESAERMLAAQERGLGLVDRHSGVPRGVRVSRLLVLADDGAERFYRQVERLLRRYGPRVLAVRLETDADALGELLFGTNGRARLLMLNHKEAVSAFLLAMTDS